MVKVAAVAVGLALAKLPALPRQAQGESLLNSGFCSRPLCYEHMDMPRAERKLPPDLSVCITNRASTYLEESHGDKVKFYFLLCVYGTLKSRGQRSANVKVTALKCPSGCFLLR